MKNIENVQIVSLTNPKFVFPIKIKYIQNGVHKEWEAVKSHDSIAILLYHQEKDSFVLVKQFRPPVYNTYKDHGFTYELCAGILDKDVSPLQTAIEEIDEECGYRVDSNSVQKITSFYTNVGVSGAKQTLYYAQINESMKIHSGGGIHAEVIELVYLPTSQAKTFALDESKPKTPGLMFALYWFFDQK